MAPENDLPLSAVLARAAANDDAALSQQVDVEQRLRDFYEIARTGPSPEKAEPR